jgi:hypothetical protein
VSLKRILEFCAVLVLSAASLNAAVSEVADAVKKGNDVPVIQYLVEEGADLAAHDLGKKSDGAFGSSIEPLMPLDYAFGVGTFRPNNAIVFNEDAVKLMTRVMQGKGIRHTRSECTLRGFTCSTANVDPKTATPAQIALIRKIQIGYQVDGLTGVLGAKDQYKK